MKKIKINIRKLTEQLQDEAFKARNRIIPARFLNEKSFDQISTAAAIKDAEFALFSRDPILMMKELNNLKRL